MSGSSNIYIYIYIWLKQAAGGISLHVDAEKTANISFNKKGNIFILNASFLKLVDEFNYIGNSVTSTENYINIRLTKAWTAILKLLIIW